MESFSGNVVLPACIPDYHLISHVLMRLSQLLSLQKMQRAIGSYSTPSYYLYIVLRHLPDSQPWGYVIDG